MYSSEGREVQQAEVALERINFLSDKEVGETSQLDRGAGRIIATRSGSREMTVLCFRGALALLFVSYRG